MAYGLRLIANKSYNCYGDGRDWFFLGDIDYQGGRRTPPPNAKQRQNNALVRPRSLLPEVRYQKLRDGSRRKVFEKWKEVQKATPSTFGPQQALAMGQAASAPSTADLGKGPAARSSEAKTTTFVTTSDMLGRDPRWSGKRYELPVADDFRAIGVPRSSSEPVLKEMEGDFTRGIRGPGPSLVSTYMDLGQVRNPSLARKHEVLDAGVRRDAGVPPAHIPPKDIEGDYSLGIKGKLPDCFATNWDLGQSVPLPRWMGARRHQDPNAENLRDAGVPPREIPPKEIEGDLTQGIRGSVPEHFTDMSNLGRFQKWDRKRYDFGPVAYKQHRLTMWGDRRS